MFGRMAIKNTIIQIFDTSNIFLDIAHFRSVLSGLVTVVFKLVLQIA